MLKYALAVLAYIVATFATQATSHFAVNTEHYATIAHLRGEPIFALGVLSMVIQGTVFSLIYTRSEWAGRSMLASLSFAWLIGSAFVSYIAFAEAAKYTVPSIGSWLLTEIGAGFVQFTLFGLLLGLIYARQPRPVAA